MIRLALSEVRHDFGAFVALAIAQTTSGIWVALSLYFVASVHSSTGRLALVGANPGSSGVLTQITVFMLILGIIVPSAFVLSVLGAARITLARSRIAKWRLSGASPRQVSTAIVLQSMILAVMFGLAGALVAIPLAQNSSNALMQVTDVGVEIPAHPTAFQVMGVVLFVVITSVLGSWLPARRAAKVQAIEALGELESHGRKLGWARLGSLLVVLIACASTAVAILGEKYNGAASGMAILFGSFLLIAVALMGPWVLPWSITAWTRIVPRHISPAWFLASHAATGRVSTANASTTPFILGAGLVGIYFSEAQTWAAASGSSAARSALILGQGSVLFLPAAVIAVVGSVLAIGVSGRSRSRDQALLRALGISPMTSRAQPILEASILAFTAFLLAASVSLCSVLLYATNLKLNGYPWTVQLDLRGSIVVTVVAFMGLAASLTITQFGGRTAISAALAADA